MRFIFNQYRLSCRIGFTPSKALRRAISAYRNGF